METDNKINDTALTRMSHFQEKVKHVYMSLANEPGTNVLVNQLGYVRYTFLNVVTLTLGS